MIKIYQFLKCIGIFIGLILISMLLVTILQYFNISLIWQSILKIFMIIISLFISTFFLGRNSNKKGYIKGLYFGLIIIVLSLIIKLLFFIDSFSLRNIIYYIIIIISSILGSMFGIQKKKGF